VSPRSFAGLTVVPLFPGEPPHLRTDASAPAPARRALADEREQRDEIDVLFLEGGDGT
jgi:hypothetical protein